MTFTSEVGLIYFTVNISELRITKMVWLTGMELRKSWKEDEE
jgi:hypothetical protein